MATELKVGQTLPLSISYLDQNGQKMVTDPTPDSPPQWADSTPANAALTAHPDGLTASVAAVSEGSDTVRVVVFVGGQQFSATLDLTIAAAAPPPPPAQTLTSIEIVAGTPL